jgi:hypothetical protein
VSSRTEKLALVLSPSRSILRDFRGNLVAISLALLTVLVYVLLSSLAASRCEGWSYLHAAYFTVINVTTVGFGDVTALTHAGKLLSGANALVGLLLFGVLVSLVTLAFQPGDLSGTVSIPVPEAPPAPSERDARVADDPALALLHSLGTLCGASAEDRHIENSRISIVVHRHHLSSDHAFIEIEIGLDRSGPAA